MRTPRNKPGFHILATVDEKSYEPGRTSMGADHPLIWWHCVGKGHELYSALGHAAGTYSGTTNDPTSGGLDRVGPGPERRALPRVALKPVSPACFRLPWTVVTA